MFEFVAIESCTVVFCHTMTFKINHSELLLGTYMHLTTDLYLVYMHLTTDMYLVYFLSQGNSKESECCVRCCCYEED